MILMVLLHSYSIKAHSLFVSVVRFNGAKERSVREAIGEARAAPSPSLIGPLFFLANCTALLSMSLKVPSKKNIGLTKIVRANSI